MTLSLLQQANPNFLQSIRLVATDMDGTLTHSGKFTPALLQVLIDLAQAAIPVVIVTGRSAGWVNGLVSYLPIAGAIAENGGIFYPHADTPPDLLVPIPNLIQHRQQLADLFTQLQKQFPQIQEAADNQFRLTDWTFDVQGLSPSDLKTMGDRCQAQGWSFTYSTVQCHIKPLTQDKAMGLLTVLRDRFSDYQPDQVVTVGDSPNDESLFNPNYFPHSVGVANIMHYRDRLHHQPTYVTQGSESEGFCQLATLLLENVNSTS